jgi:hypothetical protein
LPIVYLIIRLNSLISNMITITVSIACLSLGEELIF